MCNTMHGGAVVVLLHPDSKYMISSNPVSTCRGDSYDGRLYQSIGLSA